MTTEFKNMSWLRGLITAFVFLTRVPMPHLDQVTPQDSGRALPLFPLVGLVLGAVLSITAWLLSPYLSSEITAAIIITVWVFFTGGLHIDGLADSADGWLGGLGDKERTLTIMKDPRCGSAAVMTVVCLLLLKFSAAVTLIEQQQWLVFIAAPVIGRCVSLILFLTTPYVSVQGLAQDFIDYASRSVVFGVTAVAIIGSGFLLGLAQLLLTLSVCALLLFALRQLMMARLGGNTGDTTGASLEIIEAAVMICACAVIY